MKYIYDIVLNFNDYLYDIYEWESSDKIDTIKKILIFKVSRKDLYNLVNYKCRVSNDFLKKIYNKTETSFKRIKYASLFTDKYRVVAVIFDNNGYNIKFSSMLLDEEDEAINNLPKDFYKLNYKVLSKIDKPNKLRYITKIENYNKEYLKDLYDNKKYDEIKYLYIESTGKYNNISIKDKYNELVKSSIEYKLYKIIKDTNKKKLNNLSS